MSLIDFRVYPGKKVVEIDAKHNFLPLESLRQYFIDKEIPLNYRIRFTDLTFKDMSKLVESAHISFTQDTSPSIELEIE